MPLFAVFSIEHSLEMLCLHQIMHYKQPCQEGWENHNPDNKVHGANMGPTWVLSAPDGPQMGPMLAPWKLLSGGGGGGWYQLVYILHSNFTRLYAQVSVWILNTPFWCQTHLFTAIVSRDLHVAWGSAPLAFQTRQFCLEIECSQVVPYGNLGGVALLTVKNLI